MIIKTLKAFTLRDTSTQSITVVATKGTVSETLSFSIAGLTLAE